MRLAFEPEVDWRVEILEESREHIAAQAAFVLVDYERRGHPTDTPTQQPAIAAAPGPESYGILALFRLHVDFTEIL
jgi:hypothetical protein